MSETRYYKVAGHCFGVTAEAEVFELMGNYEPFEECTIHNAQFKMHNAQDFAFSLIVGNGRGQEYTEELRQEDEEQDIICGHTADGRAVFEFLHSVGSERPKVECCRNGETAGWLVCSNGYREGRLVMTGSYRKLAIDNALMVLFALATADKGTALFHAAVVSHKGKAYMFLGPSGTGKSTHARLWLRASPQPLAIGGEPTTGAELVNDDNPVVRVGGDGSTVVYGTPWSGKTPCYRNVSYPLGGIVLLSQAPHNKIRRLSGIEAYAALVPSISGKRWDAQIADGLHQTENALATNVPVWHLECLPDEEAARLCATQISNEQ